MIISPHDAIQLPLHDALVLGMSVTPIEGGFFSVTLSADVSREESVHLLRKLGITTSELYLIFSDCWQVKTNILGYATAQEVISKFEIKANSELINKLHAAGVGSQTMTHFRIEGSHGSQLDFVAETFSVAGRG